MTKYEVGQTKAAAMEALSRYSVLVMACIAEGVTPTEKRLQLLKDFSQYSDEHTSSPSKDPSQPAQEHRRQKELMSWGLDEEAEQWEDKGQSVRGNQEQRGAEGSADTEDEVMLVEDERALCGRIHGEEVNEHGLAAEGMANEGESMQDVSSEVRTLHMNGVRLD